MTKQDWKWDLEEYGYVYTYHIKEGKIAKFVLKREGTGATGPWTLEVWQSHRSKPNVVFNYIKTMAKGIEQAEDILKGSGILLVWT
jgi:hypothetical protein